jgi:DNA-binding FrmR family transcriptional regulator
MVDGDRYCLDVVQQINSETAGLREVSRILVESLLRTIVAEAVKKNDGEAVIAEMLIVLRKTPRRWVK